MRMKRMKRKTDPINLINYHISRVEGLARELCDTYYLTVDPRPERKMTDAYTKITEKTRDHWRAQASLLIERGWRRA